MFFLAQIDIVSTVERLGGWGVVVWIVWWLTKRWEVRMGEQCSAIKALAESLAIHERAEAGYRERLFEKQEQIHQELVKFNNGGWKRE